MASSRFFALCCSRTLLVKPLGISTNLFSLGVSNRFFHDSEENSEEIMNSSKPPQITTLQRDDWLDGGCDFKHWRVWTEPLRGAPSTNTIIHYYISILAKVLGSEEEAKKKIYSVATRSCYAFGANVSMEQADMIDDAANVWCILPDNYLNRITKKYPWDSFINGQALTYDANNYPKALEGLCFSIYQPFYRDFGRYPLNKIIDFIDDAGSRVRIIHAQLLEEVWELEKELREITSLKYFYIKRSINSSRYIDLSREVVSREWELKAKIATLLKKEGKEIGIETDEVVDEIYIQQIIKDNEDLIATRRAIDHAFAHPEDVYRPLSCLLPSSSDIDKDYLARNLADYYYGSEDDRVYYNMNDYAHSDAVAKLIGSVGRDGKLIEEVRCYPYTVIVFEEIEKARRDVFNKIIQIIEQGFLKDQAEEKVDFKDTLLILTSNVAAK